MNIQNQLNAIRNNPNMMKNPTVQSVFYMLDIKDSNGLRTLLNNTCNTYGRNPNDVLRKYK